jgi:hypothetical protein
VNTYNVSSTESLLEAYFTQLFMISTTLQQRPFGRAESSRVRLQLEVTGLERMVGCSNGQDYLLVTSYGVANGYITITIRHRFDIDKNQHYSLFLTTNGVNGDVANQRRVGGVFE